MPADTFEWMLSGVDQVIPREELEARLALGRPLRVKFGVDPSRPDLHLGHAVPLRTLKRFQDEGHVAVLIIGDFTARVGDPSGRSETRPMLTSEEIEQNARTYLDQAGMVLDMGAAEVRHNAEWLAPLRMEDVLRMTAQTTVAQLLERDDFSLRYREGRPISLVEFLYPLLQGMDSVAVKADVELGGADQTFNLLMGREMQRDREQPPQVVITVPLLEGTDGVRKMSKTYDNAVGLTDDPGEMFGRLMRIPDELIVKYVRLCTDLGPEEILEIERGLADGSRTPNEEKRGLARAVVDLYHGSGAGDAAEEGFNRIHRDRAAPEDVPGVRVEAANVLLEKKPGVLTVSRPALLVELGLASSRSEARRLIAQEGVRVDGEVVHQEEERLVDVDPRSLIGQVWQVGRRRFARVEGLD
jgi:tyrosyl-tRNA synthetase